jgi:hypothetical protein
MADPRLCCCFFQRPAGALEGFVLWVMQKAKVVALLASLVLQMRKKTVWI